MGNCFSKNNIEDLEYLNFSVLENSKRYYHFKIGEKTIYISNSYEDANSLYKKWKEEYPELEVIETFYSNKKLMGTKVNKN